MMSIHAEQFGMPIFPLLNHEQISHWGFDALATGMDRGTHELPVILFPYESRDSGLGIVWVGMGVPTIESPWHFPLK